MANAKLKGTFSDLTGTEYSTSGGGGSSSQTFTINNANDIIPSNTTTVRLNSTIGDVTMSGTPIIAAGTTEGQRLITIIDSASTGNVQFTGGVSAGIQPIASPVTIKHYGGDYQEAIEWVWVDGFWKTVSTPAQNPITVPITLPANASFELLEANMFFIQNYLVWDNLTTAPLIVSNSGVQFQVTSPLDLNSTVAFTDLSGYYGKFLYIINAPYFSTANVYLYDSAYSIAEYTGATDLTLATPRVCLKPGDWLLLMHWPDTNLNTEWKEVTRSQTSPGSSITFSGSGAHTFDADGQETVSCSLATANVTSGTPSITAGFDGQEFTIWNKVGSTFDVVLDDDASVPGTTLKLTTASVTMTPGSSVRFKYDKTADLWVEINRVIF